MVCHIVRDGMFVIMWLSYVMKFLWKTGIRVRSACSDERKKGRRKSRSRNDGSNSRTIGSVVNETLLT